MAQLDVYPNPDPVSGRAMPYVVEIQSDLLRDLATAMVIPLGRPERMGGLPILRLNPRVEVEGQLLLALPQDMAAVPRRLLKKPVAHLANQRDALLSAIDMLFTGF